MPTPARIAVSVQPSTIDSMPSASLRRRRIASSPSHSPTSRFHAAEQAGAVSARAAVGAQPVHGQVERPSRSRPRRAARAAPTASRTASPLGRVHRRAGRGSRPAGRAGAAPEACEAAARTRTPSAERPRGRPRPPAASAGQARPATGCPRRCRSQVVDDHASRSARSRSATTASARPGVPGQARSSCARQHHQRTLAASEVGGPSSAASRRAARPRWEIAAFSSRVISAMERSPPSGRNTRVVAEAARRRASPGRWCPGRCRSATSMRSPRRRGPRARRRRPRRGPPRPPSPPAGAGSCRRRWRRGPA